MIKYQLKFIILTQGSRININFKYHRFYEATIEDVANENLKVKFEGYSSLEVVSLEDVKPLVSGLKRPLSGDESK